MNATQADTHPPRPDALNVVADNIPRELKLIKQWVVWRSEYDESRRQWTKIPYRSDGNGRASSTSPSTWSSFDRASALYSQGMVDGIGFVVTIECGIIGIDLDHCFDPAARKGEPWAIDIIQKMKSYSEFSPSGEGVRIFIKGTLPHGVAGKKKGNIEIYSTGRYLTVTGHRLKNAPLTIEPRQAEIDWLFQKFFTEQEARPKPNGNSGGAWYPSDDELLEKAFDARNGDKLKGLFEGDISPYPSQSEADLALCSLLAFWAADEAQLDRLFRRSALYRDKWDQKHGAQTYGEATIAKAWASTTEHYDPRQTANGGRDNKSHLALNAQPELSTEALHGLAGDIVKAIEPYTESDRVAVLSNVLDGFGNMVGPIPYFRVEHTRHHLNLFVAQVGDTSKGRKGTSWSTPRRMFADIDSAWAESRVTGGLSSGEGLINAVRDKRYEKKPIREKGRVVDYENVLVDEGVDDKRLMLIEEELSQALRVMAREGNILSAIVRQAWDHGNLNPLTKSNPIRATGAHISIVGHITKEELLRYLTETEQANGFANRFIWLMVYRSKCIPNPVGVPEEILNSLIGRLRDRVEAARRVGEMVRTDEAEKVWAGVYPELSEGKPGLIGRVLGRAEAQVMRLSCIYALMDGCNAVDVDHLAAALALWDYSEKSAIAIFGDMSGDPTADRILAALNEHQEMTETDIRDLFGRHKASNEIDRALGALKAASKIKDEIIATGGRPKTVWRRCAKSDQSEER